MALKDDKTFGINTAALEVLGLVVLLVIAFSVIPEALLGETFALLGLLAPLWAPVFGMLAFYRLWVRYRRAHYHAHQQNVMLEVRIPRELRKSPLSMETVFAGLYLTFGETTFIDRNILGKTRTWFSFELVSTDGNVHFYIWTRAFFADLVKSLIYAQYPEVEVHEVEDYTKYIPFDLKKYQYFGCDFKLSEADPLPIKTYIDYGLDNPAAKEEEKTDPMANLIEFLGSLTKGHHIWLQIIIRAHRGHKRFPWSADRQNVKRKTQELINDIITKAAERSKALLKEVSDEETGGRVMALLTEGEKEKLKVLDRAANKMPYDAGVRGIYIGERDKFNALYLVGMLAGWRQFSAPSYNALTYTRYLAGFDYPWQDYKDVMRNWQRRRLYEAYRLRSWFHWPFNTEAFVFNTEELATLYHFPGEVVKTPTAPRISSRRAEAPANLPV